MQIQTLLLIVLAAITALGYVLYQYYFRTKKRGRLIVVLSFLRFIGVFGILLLLINPQFTQVSYSLEKRKLVLLADNSASVSNLNAAEVLQEQVDQLKDNAALVERFDIQTYTFGNQLEAGEVLDFSETETDIGRALDRLKTLFPNNNAVGVLLSDGNQTLGVDYSAPGPAYPFPLHALVYGDTTQYQDLAVERLQLNRYAYQGNQYPLEGHIVYTGHNAVTAKVSIKVGGQTLYSETLSLSPQKNLGQIKTTLEAKEVGVKSISLEVEALEGERNTNNNTQRAAIEVVDEKAKIALVSSILHPDIGALIAALESNGQREVDLIQPTEKSGTWRTYDLFVLYQPDASFQKILNFIKANRLNTFTVVGDETDLGTINKYWSHIELSGNYPLEDYEPVINPSYSRFSISEFDWEDYPPIQHNLGEVMINTSYEKLISATIQGVSVDAPILFTLDSPGQEGKQALMLGSGIWKWRMHGYREDQNFEVFDRFFGKLAQYLLTDSGADRLTVTHKLLFTGADTPVLRAMYYDETFEFDPNAKLSLELQKEGQGQQQMPLVLRGGTYQVDLSQLDAGEYSYTVSVDGEGLSKSGKFSIADFDPEKLFVSSNAGKMGKLVQKTNGQLYFPDQLEVLEENLVQEGSYAPIQRSLKNNVSLIDFRWLLAVVLASFAAEWFIRKYNGLL